MNTLDQARRAYGPATSPVRTGKDLEHQLFREVTAELSRAAAPDAPFPGLVEALERNRRVWTHVAASVAAPDNALPEDLRARLFYLSEFVTHQTRRLLRREGEVQPLIDLNLSVMRGLSGAAGAP